MRADLDPFPQRTSGLVDVLDRVLDKGLVIAGDIRVSLAEVELLTIRIRLLVCSIDKAQEIGLDWWKHDRYFSSNGRPAVEPGAAKEVAGGSAKAQIAARESGTGIPPMTRPVKRAKRRRQEE